MTEELKHCLDAVRENLCVVKEKERSVELRHKAHIRELVYSLCRELRGLDCEEALDMLRLLFAEIAEEGLELDRSDVICACRYIPFELGYTSPHSFFHALLKTKNRNKGASVCYVKNPYSDIAFSVFAHRFDSLTVNYAPDFMSAFEAVYHSEADYVMLPIATLTEGKKSRFLNMCRRYELKVSLVCEIEQTQGEDTMLYALASKDFEMPLPTEGLCFDVTFPCGEDNFNKVAYLAQSFGLTVTESVFLADTKDTERRYCVCTLDAANGEPDAFLCAMMLTCPEFIPTGLYNKNN